MFRRTARFAILPALIIFSLGTVPSLAGDPDRTHKDDTLVIRTGDDEIVTVAWESGALTITTQDGDNTGITVLDMEEVGAMVEDAMEGVAETLASLQLDVHMGQDNLLNLSYDDTMVEIDMDEIMGEIGEALEDGLAEIDSEHWVDSHSRSDHHQSTADLQDELDDLRREMKQLRKEMKKMISDRD